MKSYLIAIVLLFITAFNVLKSQNDIMNVIDTNNEVGTLPGDYGVSANGSGYYSISINLPPGINGMTPQLALTYNSQGGMGDMGAKWSISGLSSITRSQTNIYNDGFVDGIDYDENDQLSLDGNRLIPFGTIEFRTEFEGFSKIVPNGNINDKPSWFLVYLKNGNIVEYGNTPNSKIEAPGRTDILKWCINKISDRKGNCIEFDYIESNGVANIKEIKYGKDVSGGVLYSVSFNYSTTRPDPISYFLFGGHVYSALLLNKIEVKYKNAPIRSYTIDYNQEGLYSKLKTITMWDEGEVLRFNPTTFEWGSLSEYLAFKATNIDDLDKSDITTGDFNGDGKTDIAYAKYQLDENDDKVYSEWCVYYADGNDGVSFTKQIISSMTDWDFSHFVAMDYNGDGLDDIIRVDNTCFSFYKSKGNGFESPIPGGSCMNVENHVEFSPTDFNGDGRKELLMISSVPSQNEFHYRIDIYSFDGTALISFLKDSQYGDGYHFNSISNNIKILPGDFNGDNKSDLLIETTTNECGVFGLDELNFTLTPIYDDSFNLQHIRNTVFTGDFNGDGITDVIYPNNTTPESFTIQLLDGRANSSVFDGELSFPPSTMLDQYDDYQNYVVSDFNGDGKDDVLLVYSWFNRPNNHSDWEFQGIHWKTYYSNGTVFKIDTLLQVGPFFFSTFLFDNRYSHCDFNGDGKNDGFIYETGEYSRSWAFFIHKNEKNNLIHKITNGLGNETHFNYQPLTNSAIYEKDNELNEHLINIQPATYVVSSVEKDDGIGGRSKESYTYFGAKAHLEGRGVLGFKKVTRYDVASNLRSVVTNSINCDYFIQNIVTKENFLGSLLLSKTSYMNTVIDFGNKRIFNYSPVILQNIYCTGDPESGYVKTIRSETSYSENGNLYGNPTTIKTFIDNQNFNINTPGTNYDYSTTVNFQYNYYDINDWLISRISNKEVINNYPGEQNPYIQNFNYIYYSQNEAAQYPLLKKEFYTPNNASNYQTVTSFEYDSFGNLTKKIVSAPNFSNPPVENRMIEFEYSADYDHRFVTKTIRKANGVEFIESAQYDPKSGMVLNSTDINSLTTSFSYDSFGRIYQILKPDGNILSTEFHWSNDHVDNPVFGIYYKLEKASGLEDHFTFYDNTGRDHKHVNFSFDGTKKRYLSKTYFSGEECGYGLLKTITEPYFLGEAAITTSYEYLPTGQVKSTITPKATINNTYNGLSFHTENLANGQEIVKTFDPVGNLISATDAGGTITYHYNSAGNPTSITTSSNGLGQSTIEMTYNAAQLQDSLLDPDIGLTTYHYNPFGELITTTDAKGNTYNLGYDALGRLIEKKLLEPLQITTYTYDGPNGKGLLNKVTGWNGISFKLDYDPFSRLSAKTETIEGKDFTSKFEYDSFGNLKKETWPSGYFNLYSYKNGYLWKVYALDTLRPIWQLSDMNARDQILEYDLGNALTTKKMFDEYGFPVSISTGRNVQNLAYQFDPTTGNISWRKDLLDITDPVDDLTETFSYDLDVLNNRLISWEVSGAITHKAVYSANGNIDQKTDVGERYIYQNDSINSRPHAVSKVEAATTDFLAAANQQEIDYTPFNKVGVIKNINNKTSLKIEYGPDETRKITTLSRVINGGNNILFRKKCFVGNNYEVETDELGRERKLHYLFAGDGLFAIYVIEKDTGIINYIHKDYQGSYQAITDGNGNILEKLSFDPWGRRRNPSDWSMNNVPATFLFDRGYTGHEHLDQFGLINMNGRVYDPFVARFLSPDPFIPNATATQSFNRYSYCINNPLKYTDPSGFTQKPDDYEFRHGDGTSNTFNAPHFCPGYQHSLADWSNSENYFEWAHLYYSGVTETNYLEYIFSGGQYLLNGSGVVASYSNMSAQFYYDYLTGNNDYMKKNLLGLAWDAGRGNTGVGVSFTDPPKGQGGGLGTASTIFGAVGVAGDVTSMSNSTFRLMSGANGTFSPKIYNSGWNGGSPARITTYSLSKVGTGVSTGASVVTTYMSYNQIYNGEAQPITYVDAGVGTAGILAAGASYFYGVQIPVVGEFVAVYGALRLTWDVSFYLGTQYGPSKWYGTNDNKWFK